MNKFFNLFGSFFISQIAFVTIVSTDLIFLSRAGISGLAGAGLAALAYSSVYMFFHGFAVTYSNVAAEMQQSKKLTKNFLKIMFLLCVIAVFIYYLIFPLINFLSRFSLKQSEEIIYFTRYYLIMGLALPLQLFFNIKRYEAAVFESYKLPAITYIILAILNAVLNFYLILLFKKLNYLLVDAVAYSSIITWLIGIIILELGVKRELNKNYILSDIDLKDYIKRGSRLGFAFVTESFYFAWIAALVGIMGIHSLAASNVINNIIYIAFMVPVAISNAISIIISSERNKTLDKKSKIYSLMLCAFSTSCLMIITIWPSYFLDFYYPKTNPDFSAVLQIFEKICFFMVIFHILDCLQNILSGVMRAFSLENKIGLNIMLGLWLIGGPLSLLATIYLNNYMFIWAAATAGMGIVVLLHAISIQQHFRISQDLHYE